MLPIQFGWLGCYRPLANHGKKLPAQDGRPALSSYGRLLMLFSLPSCLRLPSSPRL